MLGMDPPDPKRMRDVVAAVFTPKMIRSLKPNIRRNASDIMQDVLSMEECDAVEDFGAKLAVRRRSSNHVTRHVTPRLTPRSSLHR